MRGPSHPQRPCTWISPDRPKSPPPALTGAQTAADGRHLKKKSTFGTPLPTAMLVSAVHCIVLALQVVVVWVLCHAAIDEGPGEVVDRILLVLNGLGHHLSVEMVVKKLVQV